MSYVRANTGISVGWRPNALQLSGLRVVRRPRAGQIRRRALRGLGSLDLGTQMVNGAQYVFHFTYSSLSLSVDPKAVAQQIAADGNFLNPVAAQEPSSSLFGNAGMQVRFTYNGQQSTIGDAGNEMQNVINTFALMGFGGLYFASAEGPGGTQAASSNQAAQSGGSAPAAASNSQNPGGGTPPFDWHAFWAGLGTGGAGTLGVLAVAVILLLRD